MKEPNTEQVILISQGYFQKGKNASMSPSRNGSEVKIDT